MNADGAARDVGHALAEGANQATVLLGYRVAGGIGDVDDGSAGVDGGFDHFEQIRWIGAAGIFGVELDIIGVFAREFDGGNGHLQDFSFLFGEGLAVAFILKFSGNVNIGSADAGVNAGTFGLGQRFAAGVDVIGNGAGKSADGRTVDFLRDELDGLEVLG